MIHLTVDGRHSEEWTLYYWSSTDLMNWRRSDMCEVRSPYWPYVYAVDAYQDSRGQWHVAASVQNRDYTSRDPRRVHYFSGPSLGELTSHGAIIDYTKEVSEYPTMNWLEWKGRLFLVGRTRALYGGTNWYEISRAGDKVRAKQIKECRNFGTTGTMACQLDADRVALVWLEPGQEDMTIPGTVHMSETRFADIFRK